MRELDFQNIPEMFRPLIESGWMRIQETLSKQSESFQQQWQTIPDAFYTQFPHVLVASDYVVDQFSRFPQQCVSLLLSGVIWQSQTKADIRRALQSALQNVKDETELNLALRHFRRVQMIRIIWRDILKLADLIETTHDLTELADACIAETLHYHYQWLSEKWGTPCFKGTDKPMPMVVLGMGKLGAHELNLSSDIDLIFAYTHEGETRHLKQAGAAASADNNLASGGALAADRTLGHREFFTRLGQRLIKSLDEITAHGFVFRVDMRLRPYGKSGALALTFNGMESYYEEQGREWERYAMIKARPMGEDGGEGEKLMEILRPFVYRRYVDFGVIDSLRDMKAMINREVLRRGAIDNVKTGSGGIREVEFIAQAFQLIRGGQEKQLQHRSLLTVLKHLGELKLLPLDAVASLREAYIFLRDSEHRIQALQDRQTQNLPDDDMPQARLAFSMGADSWEDYTHRLDQYRHSVRDHFEHVISGGDEQQESDEDDHFSALLWLKNLKDAERDEAILQLGYTDVEQTSKLILDFKQHKIVLHLQPLPRQRLDRLMPLLLLACGHQENAEESLQRSLMLVEAVLRRSAYIAMLVENPHSLDHLAKLCGASPWVADSLTRYPVLLDELIDANTLYAPPPVESLKDELRQQLLRIPEDDFEQQLECLRQFKHSHVLRVAASDIAGTLPLMKVSDYLTWIAETLLQSVLDIAWQQMVQRYGAPQESPGVPCKPEFIIVGYGKVGGIELSYSSDLDLVFIHDIPWNQTTEGENGIDNGVFLARLGQRIIHILTTRTPSGLLYETDMRLRPSGNAGLLVSSLKAFNEYQEEKAWTWEHQALVRARFMAGSETLRQSFETARRQILSKPRDEQTLRNEVQEMRQKMVDHLSKSGGELNDESFSPDKVFDIKQDPGGVVDIEFLVQYLALRWGGEHPDMLTYTDNMRILETAEKVGVLSGDDAELLKEAYLEYRGAAHRQALQHQKGAVSAVHFKEYRLGIREIWNKVIAV